ncbi:ferredoxin [Mycobacterium sp. BMJ-28]
MKVSVVRDRCQGNGQCEAVAPSLFHLDEDDIAVFSHEGQSLPAELEDDATSAIEACPVRALIADE